MRADPAAGSVVRLRDVARIELGALQYASSAFFGEDPTVVLGVFQMPGSNALDLQQRVKDKMEELSKRFPKGIEYAMHYDTTRFVSASMHDVLVTLGEALVLVVAVVFIFLQSWRTTIIPTIAIPVSLIATLVVMHLLGFSLNMLSLLGMVLAIGLVVDDAIVVVENVERQLEAGLPPLEATREAMSEVTGPIIATTAVLMAVFVPVAFIPGVAGRLYNQFALTVAISVGISAFNSLTLSPALSAAFLRHRGADDISRRSAGSTPASTGCRMAMPACVRSADPAALGDAGRVRRGAGAPPMRSGSASRRPSCRSRTRATSSSSSSLPDGASLQRTDAVARAGARHPAGHARRRDRRLDQRPQFPDQRGAIELGGRVRHPEAVGRAAARSRARPRSSPRCGRSCCGIPDAIALSFDPPSIPGLGATGGFEFQVEDLTGRGRVALTRRRRR